jgi:hypothetical protein
VHGSRQQLAIKRSVEIAGVRHEPNLAANKGEAAPRMSCSGCEHVRSVHWSAAAFLHAWARSSRLERAGCMFLRPLSHFEKATIKLLNPLLILP